MIIAAAIRMHPFCNIQSRVRTHAVLVIGLYELVIQLPNSLFLPRYTSQYLKQIAHFAYNNNHSLTLFNIQKVLLFFVCFVIIFQSAIACCLNIRTYLTLRQTNLNTVSLVLPDVGIRHSWSLDEIKKIEFKQSKKLNNEFIYKNVG